MKRIFRFILFLFANAGLIFLIANKCIATENYPLTLRDSFEKLMGSETIAWKHLVNSYDHNCIDFYKKNYEKHRDKQFDTKSTFNIPRVVHLIWLGPLNFPSKSVTNIRSWIKRNPNWTFVFWTDRKRLPPCPEMEVRYIKDFQFGFLEREFALSQNWGEKADILRYEILYQEGGVYTDHDANCLLPFDNLTAYDFFACLEMPHRERIGGRAVTVGIGVIGSKPEHPILLAAINNVMERWDEITNNYSVGNYKLIMNRTYIAMTYACEEHLNLPRYSNIVFPSCYFYPQYGLPAFYSYHFYSASWSKPRPKRAIKR